MPGLDTRPLCGFVRALSDTPLFCGRIALPGTLLSVCVLLGESRAFLKRLGGSAKN
jgi:hypothetical protein